MAVERPDNPRVLIPKEQVQARVKELAKEIEEFYQDTDITAICILNGSFVFFSDLIRQINFPISCEFLGVSSRRNQAFVRESPRITLDLTVPIAGKHVLIVEDIVDSGNTAKFLLQTLLARNPASIQICSLLVKSESKGLPEVNFIGFQIGNEFVVGYGTDHQERYRGLSYIGAVERPL